MTYPQDRLRYEMPDKAGQLVRLHVRVGDVLVDLRVEVLHRIVNDVYGPYATYEQVTVTDLLFAWELEGQPLCASSREAGYVMAQEVSDRIAGFVARRFGAAAVVLEASQ